MLPLQSGPKWENMNSEICDANGESKKSYGTFFAWKVGSDPFTYAKESIRPKKKKTGLVTPSSGKIKFWDLEKTLFGNVGKGRERTSK
mmetsp:Transcript_15264/g.31470  ORF Transcript_15264/g.31470 Transcript_15264/m.31470 type:complete len:88 (-) Transcript_15264:109-372(-)